MKSNLKRKLGSSSEDSSSSFVASLDEDLRRKLDSIGEHEQQDAREVSAEKQAERAARVCDIKCDK